MHKTVPVAAIDIDDSTCKFSKIKDVYETDHLPIGIECKNHEVNRDALGAWWTGRAIPENRLGLKKMLDTMKMEAASELLPRGFGLSLSDQYWISPKNNNQSWENVNFFTNSFSEDVGNTILEQNNLNKEIDFNSPDNTSGGWLPKKWTIINNKRCLIKMGSGNYQQEPYNEAIASSIMKRLNLSHASYMIMLQDGKPYCACEDFITPETELVSARDIMQSFKNEKQNSPYMHFIDCCSALGVDVSDSVHKMLILDYIIDNQNRNLLDFGLIRDVKTLKYIGMAPIYDSGTSLWYDKTTKEIKELPYSSAEIKTKRAYDWLDKSGLYGIDEEVYDILNMYSANKYLDEARISAISKGVKGRVKAF